MPFCRPNPKFNLFSWGSISRFFFNTPFIIVFFDFASNTAPDLPDTGEFQAMHKDSKQIQKKVF
jgi:hypothetical protein